MSALQRAMGEDRTVKIANLRFYSGDGTGGGGTSQVDNGSSQAETRESTTAETVQDAATEDEKTAEKIARANKEAASYRTQLREAEKRLEALQAQVEEASTASMSEAEKLKAANAKLQEQIKQAQAQVKEAERQRMAQAAVSEYKLPGLAVRALQGETQPEIDEDAKGILKELTAWAKQFMQVTPPNPEGGDKSGVTAAANGKPSEKDVHQITRSYKTGV